MISQIANNKSSSPLASRKKYQAPQRPANVQEVKQKCANEAGDSTKPTKPKSPKLLKKFKVKQMASIFNSKISQIMRRDADARRYNALVNELSPAAKPAAQATLANVLPVPRSIYTSDKALAPSPGHSTSMPKIQKKSEEVFAQLNVKEKALLYSQFVDEMSRNPKFGQHADFTKSSVAKEDVAGEEVVREKQGSVKSRLEELEARCEFPKHTFSAVTVQHLKSLKRLGSSMKSKEFEDVTEQKEKFERRTRSLPLHKIDKEQFLLGMELSETSIKGNQIASSSDVAPQAFFENQHLERLFYSWLEQRHERTESQNEASESSELDEEKRKSAVDKLLEEASTKLKTLEIKQSAEEIDTAQSNEEPTDFAPKLQLRKKKRAPAVPQQQASKPVVTSESSTTSSPKHSEIEDSESGISQNSSDRHQHETTEQSKQNATFTKPVKPLRKKKMRRTLSWKKDSSVIQTNTNSTTDSEADCNPITKKTLNKTQVVELKPQPIVIELNRSQMRAANSPRKIKSDNTFTVFSPSRDKDCSFDRRRESVLANDITGVVRVPEQHALVDSFDQGFETGSNEVYSPVRPAPKSARKSLDNICSPRLIKLRPAPRMSEIPSNYSTPIKSRGQQNLSSVFNDVDSPIRIARKPTLDNHHTQSPLAINSSQASIDRTAPNFSTPIKSRGQQNLSSAFNEIGVRQQICSPISMPLKTRRRSIYSNESRRATIATQVIREDHSWENPEIQQSSSNTSKSDNFRGNATTIEVPSTSSFWIKSGDFSVALDIYKNDPERVKLLYEIFSQRSCDTKDIDFGIDGHKFSAHKANEQEMGSKRLPQNKETSHYWFSTGDLTLPFSGKPLTSEKIQRLFQFVKASVEETGVLRFGLDDVEFSKAPEFWTQTPKYSMDSNYSMLVGLQSGHSNGLEGRSKYAWPYSKAASDFEFESDDFEEIESVRSSLSPFGSTPFDLASWGSEELMMARSTESMTSSPEFFSKAYENEPLDRLFGGKHSPKQKTQAKHIPPATVSELLSNLETQKQNLSSVKESLSRYTNPAVINCDALDALKGTPEYLNQLKSIVSDINNIGRTSNGFNGCSSEELERYMCFLSSYADISLNSCNSHMDKIMNALSDHRAIYV